MEGDSELEEAVNLYAVDMSLPRLQSGSSPGSSSSNPGSSPQDEEGQAMEEEDLQEVQLPAEILVVVVQLLAEVHHP